MDDEDRMTDDELRAEYTTLYQAALGMGASSPTEAHETMRTVPWARAVLEAMEARGLLDGRGGSGGT